MNETRYYRSIGIFVSIGFLCILFLAIRISAGSFLYSAHKTYRVDIEFSNIGRLKPQSKIVISGVTVGRVASIMLSPENFTAHVHCEIDEDYQSIPEDSRVAIVTAGLLGDNYLAIYPGFAPEYWHEGSFVDQSQTTPALVLEELISKVVSTLSSRPSSAIAGE